MQSCPTCGAQNRPEARFCFQCAAPLAAPSATAALLKRPASDDAAWLAATLAASSTSHQAQPIPAPLAPLDVPSTIVIEKGIAMEPQSQPDAPTLLGGRYEQVARTGDMIEVIDRAPWKRCWACGATSNEAGELYCTECGAALAGRHYHGVLRGGELKGLALIAEVKDPVAREMLPQLWDEITTDAETLVLAVESGREPIAPPLGELDAIHLGLGLARLLVALHAEGFTLGEIAIGDVELTPASLPRLRASPELKRGGDQANDLQELAALLEASTATPRTTKRLSEEQADAASVAPGLPNILSALRTGEIADAAALINTLEALLAERTAPVPLWVRVGARSDTGVVRDHNEDSLLSLDLRTDQNNAGRAWGLYIVADGMGGHSAGEVASGLAIRGAAEAVMRGYLTPTLEMDTPYEEDRLKETVFKAITQANEYVLREASARGNDMGTTITMAVLVGNRAVIGNVGDSRTYLFRSGELRRVSKDHSLVQRLVDLGQISPDDAYTHPQRNAVLRSLGDKADVGIDLFVERLQPGDTLLCCSDGLWEMIRDPQIAEILTANPDPQAAADALIVRANQNGGEDNISAVVVQFVGYGEKARS